MARSDEVFEEANTSMKEYVDSVEPIKKQRKQRKLKRLIMLVILALVLVGGAIWFFFLREPKKEQLTPSAQPETQQPADEPDEEVVTTTEKYVSQAFSLTFDYPTNWEIDDTEPTVLQIMSPITRIKDTDGNIAEARVVVKVRPKGAALAEFTGTSTAVRASEKMSYSQPSAAQRGQTFLTFVGHSGAGLDAVYITGDNGYEKDGFVPKTDVAQADPIISVQLVACPQNRCDSAAITSLSVENEAWEDNAYLQQAKILLQSLVIS